jgi:hypothetical protein
VLSIVWGRFYELGFALNQGQQYFFTGIGGKNFVFNCQVNCWLHLISMIVYGQFFEIFEPNIGDSLNWPTVDLKSRVERNFRKNIWIISQTKSSCVKNQNGKKTFLMTQSNLWQVGATNIAKLNVYII